MPSEARSAKSQPNVPDKRHAVSVLRRINSAYVLSVVSIVLVIVAALLVVYRLNPPPAAGVNAPLTEFSAERALKHLTVIAQNPHPVGTSEHAAVASYIQNELAALGLRPEIQQTPDATNILVRLKGTTDEKAVALVCHYDSVPPSPGASDDGAAVVSILETLRALKSSQPLRNDVIALFTDAEEVGMLGAVAFVYRHPWAKDVGVVLNFDARGSSGPVLMFETSPKNGWLIKEFGKAAPHPTANSLSQAIYELMPNKTDFTIFKERGLVGLNFAHIVGRNYYHSSLDNLTNLDHRTLQHQGSTALALTRHFGNLNLTSTADHNGVYFDVLNSTLISYSEQWVVPLAVVVFLIFVALVAFGFKNNHLTVNGLLISVTAVPLSVISTVVLLFPIKALLQMAVSSEENNLWMALLIVITICVLLVVNGKLSRAVGVSNLMAGGYLWSLILLALTSLFLKGGSYLFTWSFLFNLGALGFVLARKGREIFSIKHLMLLVLGAVPGIILFTPLIYLMWVALTLRSFVALFAIVGITVLLLGPLTPHFAVVTALRKTFPGVLEGRKKATDFKDGIREIRG
ncbi:MAG TPA: M28 family peptidase [Pyrinomonadaceae bacterium]|nr:M28 family peptidase [Pyrinomonadaceae bacterium]